MSLMAEPAAEVLRAIRATDGLHPWPDAPSSHGTDPGCFRLQSRISYLVDQSKAREAARVSFDVVYGACSQLPGPARSDPARGRQREINGRADSHQIKVSHPRKGA
jgi:hypothetical protein